MAHDLQRLRQNDVVERLIGEGIQSLLDVHLNDLNPGFHGFHDIGRVDFEPVPGHLSRFLEVTQQSTVATPQIEDVGTRLHPVGDEFEIRTQSSHAANSAATRRM